MQMSTWLSSLATLGGAQITFIIQNKKLGQQKKKTNKQKTRLRPKGVGEEGVGEKLNRVFSGFFPWQVREWYVPGPSRHHQIPNFLRTLHIFQQVFPGF